MCLSVTRRSSLCRFSLTDAILLHAKVSLILVVSLFAFYVTMNWRKSNICTIDQWKVYYTISNATLNFVIDASINESNEMENIFFTQIKLCKGQFLRNEFALTKQCVD